MATCGFCKKEIYEEDFRQDKCFLKLAHYLYLISCPHCDSVIGTYARD